MKPYRIGVDLGGTKTECILLAPAGEELYRRRLPTPAAEGYQAILNNLLEILRLTAEQIPVHSNLSLAETDYTIGLGIPGMSDPEDGLVYNANTTCLIGKPLKADLERALGRSVALENDANCFTMAECKLGAGRGYECVFGVIMGTGCGGGIYDAGRVRTGASGIGGEWGHISIDPRGIQCYCGNRGCVETKISGSGVEREYRRRNGLPEGRGPGMLEIEAGYRRGERACVEVFEEFLDDFGRALGGLISILDPDAVVLGGGLSKIEELYTEGLERVRKYVFHRDLRTPILKHELGDSAGVYGAAWIGV